MAVDFEPVAASKLLVGGYAGAKGQRKFQLVQLDPAGSIDSTFGKDGRVVTDFGGDQRPVDMVRTGRKVILYGSGAVARFHLDGRIDKSFSGDGKLTFAGTTATGRLGVDDEGRIKLLTSNGLLAFNGDGSVDTNFGNNGALSLEDASQRTEIEEIRTLLVLADGRMILGGRAPHPDRPEINVAWRNGLLADGSIDSEFDGGLLGELDDTVITRIERLPDGRVIYYGPVGSDRFTEPYESPLAKPNKFGAEEAPSYADAAITHLVMTLDGSIYGVGNGAFGQFSVYNSDDQDLYVSRYTPDGTLDTEFGHGGYVFTEVLSDGGENPSVDLVRSAALPGGSRLVVLVTAGNGDDSAPYLLRFQLQPPNPFASVDRRQRLIVNGSPGSDTIETAYTDDGTGVRVTLNGHSLSFDGSQFSRIIISAGAGDDTVTLNTSRRTLVYGETGNDTVMGGSGADDLHGGSGDDLIHGRSGDDTLVGGAGFDTLAGLRGNDTFAASDGSVDILDDGSGEDIGDVDEEIDLITSIETT